MIEDRAPVPDAYLRLKNSVVLLRDFPRAGVPLEDELTGLHSILGPWRWMRIIYAYDLSADRVDVITIVDTREG